MTFWLQADYPTPSVHTYVEIHSAEPPAESARPALRVVSALIVPFSLLCAITWIAKQNQKVIADRKKQADEQTEVLKTNNELLRENIQLQQQILSYFQKQSQ